MTRDQIIQWAREAGFEIHDRKQQARVGVDALIGIDSTDKLTRFAQLARADERERCAKECAAIKATLMPSSAPKKLTH